MGGEEECGWSHEECLRFCGKFGMADAQRRFNFVKAPEDFGSASVPFSYPRVDGVIWVNGSSNDIWVKDGEGWRDR